MTLRTNARIAGVTFLIYIVAGVATLALSGRPHATDVLSLLTSFAALVLGVTLYAITREQDPDLAMLGLTCRVVESLPGHAGAVFFAVGSALFSWLLLRGRMIPAALAWLGVVASILLVVALPLQLAGFVEVGFFAGPVGWLMWLPMLVFEVVLALWLLIKGVATPARLRSV